MKSTELRKKQSLGWNLFVLNPEWNSIDGCKKSVKLSKIYAKTCT